MSAEIRSELSIKSVAMFNFSSGTVLQISIRADTSLGWPKDFISSHSASWTMWTSSRLAAFDTRGWPNRAALNEGCVYNNSFRYVVFAFKSPNEKFRNGFS